MAGEMSRILKNKALQIGFGDSLKSDGEKKNVEIATNNCGMVSLMRNTGDAALDIGSRVGHNTTCDVSRVDYTQGWGNHGRQISSAIRIIALDSTTHDSALVSWC